MTTINIARCDDCGFVSRADFRPYNRCHKCHESTDIVIPNVSAEVLVDMLIAALSEHKTEHEIVLLLEKVESADAELED